MRAKMAARMGSPANGQVNNLVVVSDTHCGSKLGLCAPGVLLDEGNRAELNSGQKVLWRWWLAFWQDWVPHATRGERFDVVINGDLVEGVPRGTVALISSNPADQERIALETMAPVKKALERVSGRLFVIRGTEAHAGMSAADEERIARTLGAVPDEDGRYARWSLWMMVGSGLVHCMHHIGTTSSSHHEASAVDAELKAEYVEAGRTGLRPPDVVVRSHRHRWIEVRVPKTCRSEHVTFATCVVTPGWQLKTPFAWRAAGSRITMPQIGGILVRQGDNELHTRAWIKSMQRPKTVV